MLFIVQFRSTKYQSKTLVVPVKMQEAVNNKRKKIIKLLDRYNNMFKTLIRGKEVYW